MDAQVARARAQLGAREGNVVDAERLFKRAAGLFQELAVPFAVAVTRLEHAEWLTAHSRFEEAEPLRAEARAAFERLDAKRWLERMSGLPLAAVG